MIGHHIFNRAPLIERLFPYCFDTRFAEIFQLRYVRVTLTTYVLEEYINYEVGRNYFVFIFSNVFGTKFHLASLDVITSLDESRVKHYPEHCLLTKACMFEDYLDISLQNHRLLLLRRK